MAEAFLALNLWLRGKVMLSELDSLSLDDVYLAHRALGAWDRAEAADAAARAAPTKGGR